MGEKKYLPIPVSGPLDTAHPATNRRVGTLVRSVDVGHEWIGPRLGPKAWTWVGRLPSGGTTPGMFPQLEFDGDATNVVGQTSRDGSDLGTQWTLDLAFHATATRAVNAEVPIFKWLVDSTIVAINVGVYGSAHANAGKLYAVVKTTSSPGVVSGTYTLVGATPLYSASLTSGGAIVRCFVRLIRDGQSLTLLSTRGSTASTSSLTATDRHQGTTAYQSGFWHYATYPSPAGAGETFKGYIIRSLLRTTAVSTSAALQATEHRFPRAGDVIHFAGSTSLMVSGAVCVPDFSRFAAHGAQSGGAGIGSAGPSAYPSLRPIQGGGAFTDSRGGSYCAVMCGGVLAIQRMS